MCKIYGFRYKDVVKYTLQYLIMYQIQPKIRDFISRNIILKDICVITFSNPASLTSISFLK